MDILGFLELREPGFHHLEEIVHVDPVLRHDAGRSRPVFRVDLHRWLPLRRVQRARRRRSPDQVRPGPFKPCDNLPQLALVDLRGGLVIVQAKVEVDHLPVPVPEPLLKHRHAVLRRAAVLGRAVDIRLARQPVAHGDGVATGDRIADQQHPRQPGIVLHVIPRRGHSLRLFFFIKRQVIPAEGLAQPSLQGLLPRLARGVERGDPRRVFLLHPPVPGLLVHTALVNVCRFITHKKRGERNGDEKEGEGRQARKQAKHILATLPGRDSRKIKAGRSGSSPSRGRSGRSRSYPATRCPGPAAGPP